jgi:hypothetical protein
MFVPIAMLRLVVYPSYKAKEIIRSCFKNVELNHVLRSSVGQMIMFIASLKWNNNTNKRICIPSKSAD